jgi:hypothetical protein
MVLFNRSGPCHQGISCPLGLLSSPSSGGSGGGANAGVGSGAGGQLGCASRLASRSGSIDVVDSALLMRGACPCAGAEAASSMLGFDGGTRATTVDACAALASCGVLVGVGAGISGGVGLVLLCCIGGVGDSGSGCHGSKGPWLKVSIKCYLFRTSTKRLSQVRKEVAQDERSGRSWIGDKVETEVSMLHSTGLNSATP